MNAWMLTLNGYAESWASALWPVAWQSALLAVVILPLALLLRRASPQFRMWLWMLVPLRLLVMPLLTVPLPVLPPDVGAAPMGEERAFSSSEPQLAGERSLSPTETGAPSEPVTPAPRPEPVYPTAAAVLMSAWLLGMVFWALRLALAWRRARGIINGGTPVTNGRLACLAESVRAEMRLKRPLRLVVTAENVSPFACGVLRPAIVLPAHFLRASQPEEVRAVLAHEYAHIARHDPLLGLFLAVCDTLYFFHPVVHLVRRRILLEREKACDSVALAASQTRPAAYAQALVVTAAACRSQAVLTSPATVVAESFSDLKARLAAIAQGLTPTARLGAGSIILLLVLGILCVPGIALTERAPETPYTVDSSALLVPPPTTPAPVTVRTAAVQPAAKADGTVVDFPADRSLGILSVRAKAGRGYSFSRSYYTYPEWTPLGEARGPVSLPPGSYVKLEVAEGALSDLSPLAELPYGAISEVHLFVNEERFVPFEQAVMPQVAAMKGLRGLSVSGREFRGLTDAAVEHLASLKSLEHLGLASHELTSRSLGVYAQLASLKTLIVGVSPTDDELRLLQPLQNLRELSLHVDNLAGPGLAHLSALPRLEFLELNGAGLGSEAVAYLHGCRGLKSLTFWGQDVDINDRCAVHLAKMTGLEELQFIYIESISDTSMPYLAQLTSLKKLGLSHSSVSDRGLKYIPALASLEQLSLPREGITDRGIGYVAELKQLKHLDAGGVCPVDLDTGGYTDIALEYLSTLPALESLTMASGMGITDRGMASLARLPRLRVLYLLAHGVSNEGLKTLATISTLEELDIGACHSGLMTVAGVNQLTALKNLRKLGLNTVVRDEATLDLAGATALQEVAISIRTAARHRDGESAYRNDDLAWVRHTPQLRWLQAVGGTELGDTGLSHLVACKNLERLNIKGKFSDRGLSYVANIPSLDFVGIIGHDFTDDGIQQLSMLSGLTYLSISNDVPLSEPALARLKNSLPNLHWFKVDDRW